MKTLVPESLSFPADAYGLTHYSVHKRRRLHFEIFDPSQSPIPLVTTIEPIK